jgi:hypothetical protein
VADLDSERLKRKREAFLLGLGVAGGILGQTIYDMMRAIVSNDTSTERTVFIAGLVAFAIMYGALRLALGSDWKGNPTKGNTENPEAIPTKT